MAHSRVSASQAQMGTLGGISSLEAREPPAKCPGPQHPLPPTPAQPSTSKGLGGMWPQIQRAGLPFRPAPGGKAEISISRAIAWPSSPITGPLDRFRGRAAPPQGCLREGQHWPWADLGSQRETPGNGGDPQTLQEQNEKPIPFQRAEFGGWEPHCHVSLCLSWRDAGGGRCHQSGKGLVGELSPQLCFSTTSWLLPHRRKTLKFAS